MITDLKGEVWKPIDCFDKYMISNMGRLKSFTGKRGEEHLMGNSKSSKSHICVSLHSEKEIKAFPLHRLVAIAFCENDDPDVKIIINHKNENG